jgi:hypothetical protein
MVNDFGPAKILACSANKSQEMFLAAMSHSKTLSTTIK